MDHCRTSDCPAELLGIAVIVVIAMDLCCLQSTMTVMVHWWKLAITFGQTRHKGCYTLCDCVYPRGYAHLHCNQIHWKHLHYFNNSHYAWICASVAVCKILAGTHLLCTRSLAFCCDTEFSEIVWIDWRRIPAQLLANCYILRTHRKLGLQTSTADDRPTQCGASHSPRSIQMSTVSVIHWWPMTACHQFITLIVDSIRDDWRAVAKF